MSKSLKTAPNYYVFFDSKNKFPITQYLFPVTLCLLAHWNLKKLSKKKNKYWKKCWENVNNNMKISCHDHCYWRNKWNLIRNDNIFFLPSQFHIPMSFRSKTNLRFFVPPFREKGFSCLILRKNKVSTPQRLDSRLPRRSCSWKPFV